MYGNVEFYHKSCVLCVRPSLFILDAFDVLCCSSIKRTKLPNNFPPVLCHNLAFRHRSYFLFFDVSYKTGARITRVARKFEAQTQCQAGVGLSLPSRICSTAVDLPEFPSFCFSF